MLEEVAVLTKNVATGRGRKEEPTTATTGPDLAGLGVWLFELECVNGPNYTDGITSQDDAREKLTQYTYFAKIHAFTR